MHYRFSVWLPGHASFSFLLALPIINSVRKREGDLMLPLSYAAFFSVMPDFLHIGDLRMFSHSIFGATILLVAILAILSRLAPFSGRLAAIAFVATGGHLLGDWLFGHFYPAFPLET